MRRIRKFKKGLVHCLFCSPPKSNSKDVLAAHIINSSIVWAFAKK